MTDFNKKYSWWSDAARLRVGLLKRPQPQVPHLVKPKYAEELNELDRFTAWLMWFEAGRKGPRPNFTKVVPSWAWKIEAEYHNKHPHPVPPPVPPPPPASPPSRWKNAPWTKKFVASSHGCRKVDRVFSPEQLVMLAKRAGCGAVFAQIGNDTPDPDWVEHCRALHQAAHAEGLQCGAWGRVDYIRWIEVYDMINAVLPLDGFQADVEGRCDDDLLPEHLVAAFPSLPLSVVATGGIDDAFGNGAIESAKRFGDHFDFIGQDYAKAGTPLETDPAGHGENFVYWRSNAKVPGGYRHLPDAGGQWHIPMGMSNAEGTPPMKDQVQWFKPWKVKGWWDAEIIEANQEWDVFASL